jgi:hypothetical protein
MGLLTTLVILLSACAGFFVGRAVGRRQRVPEPPKPMCGCGHHRSMHKNGGRCNVVTVHTNGMLSASFHQKYPCPCTEYVGPIPVSELWTPPLLPDTDNKGV